VERGRRPRRLAGRKGGALVAVVLIAATLLTLAACGGGGGASDHRVIVLGFDGMDYVIARNLMAQGKLPNLARLAKEGHFQSLGTSVPPLSPVAWSNFITGMDSGGHGIFDFIHRDAATRIPYLSTSRVLPPGRTLELGKYQFALSGGGNESLRYGTPFWEVLEERGVETWILRIPANYPPSGTATREVSGMGTPDMLGTYGTFSFYTSELFAFAGQEIDGGDVYEVDYYDNKMTAALYGPDNPVLKERTRLRRDFTVYVDPVEEAARIVVGDEEVVVEVGGWTDWIPVEFEVLPTQTVTAQVLFYLKSVRPELELYAAPLNMDPFAPAQPISTPEDYAAELAEATGRFYTQGMPEDTKALTEGVLTPDEFLEQARIAGGELEEQFRYVLDQFESGLLFYYFGNLDLVSHMMFRATDPNHPFYDEVRDGRFAGVVEGLYMRADEIVGYTLANMGEETTLIVMSDHGFASWRRAFNLNNWLAQEGYIVFKDPTLREQPKLFGNVDWSKTRAYGLGFNGLYVNLAGRDRDGIVPESERRRLMEEIATKLLQVEDPENGQRAITKVYRREEIYSDLGHRELGPDLVIGYAETYKGSNDGTLGEFSEALFMDNEEEWSGDHSMDHETVPGVLFSNRPLKKPVDDLANLAAAVVAEFGVEEFPVPSTAAAADGTKPTDDPAAAAEGAE
jgi:predicted AlkP superfamily phosphohydrolase/phosphomutase